MRWRLDLLALTGLPCNVSGTHPRRDQDLATSRAHQARWTQRQEVPVLLGELHVGDVELGLVLHREPTRRGQPKASALTVEDSQNCALTDLISCHVAGMKRGDATRKDSEISHGRSLT